MALFLSQDNRFRRYATWFLQTEKTVSKILPPEIVALISQDATGLNDKHTRQLGAFFVEFRAAISTERHSTASPCPKQNMICV